MDAVEIIRKGEDAKRLMEDPILIGALASIEEQILDAWKCQGDSAQRDKLWYRLEGLNAFKLMLENIMFDSLSVQSMLDARAKEMKVNG